MTTLRFTADNSEVRFNLPTAVDLTGAFTIGGEVRRRAVSAWHCLVSHTTPGGTGVLTVEFDAFGNRFLIDINGSALFASTAFASTTDHLLWQITKTAGTSTPRLHVRNLTAGTTLHENFGGTLGNAPTAAGGTVRVGEFQDGDDLNANKGLLFAWKGVVLSDSQADENWANLRTSDIWNNTAGHPAYLFELRSRTSIPDLAGNGATLNVVNGTAEDTGDSVPGWTDDGIGATGTTVTLTPATETDAAVALVKAKTVALVLATEVDVAVAGTAQKRPVLAVALGSDSAVPLSFLKRAVLLSATETGQAQPITAAKTATLAPASETDIAVALNVSQGSSVTLTLAGETGQAVAVTSVKRVTLTPATETGTSVTVTATKTAILAPASETGAAVGVTPRKTATLQPAPETDAAMQLSYTGPVLFTVTPAPEADTPISLTTVKRVTIAPAIETDTAIAASRLKLVTVTPAFEADQARGPVLAFFKTLTPAGESDEAVALVFEGARAPFTYGLDDNDPAFTYGPDDDGPAFTYGPDDTPAFTYGLD